MYLKVVLTMLLVAMTVVAAGLWRPRPAPRAVAPPESPAPGELKLRQRVTAVDLRGLSREQGIALLRQQTDATLVMDWRSLAGFSDRESGYRAEQVSAYLADVPLGTALKVVLGPQATWQVDGGVITVAGNQSLPAEEMTVHIYDVSDLVDDDAWHVRTPAADAVSVRAARMEVLRDVVTQHSPGAGWHINYIGSGTPGGSASISVLGDRLIVTATTEAHTEIARVLAELRQAGRR